MTVSDVVPLHGDSHAVSHCLQQEEGSMEVEEENEGIQMTRIKFMTLRNNDKDALNSALSVFHPTTTKETSSKFSF